MQDPDKIQKLEKVILLTEKKVKLLKELKESLIFESCKFHIVEHNEGHAKRYSFFEIATKENLIFGSLQKIKSFVKRRKIDKNIIYNSIFLG